MTSTVSSPKYVLDVAWGHTIYKVTPQPLLRSSKEPTSISASQRAFIWVPFGLRRSNLFICHDMATVAW